MSRDYDPSTLQADLNQIRQEGKISEEQIRELTKYIIIAHLNGVNLKGQTYTAILDQLQVNRKSLSQSSEKRYVLQNLKRDRINPLLKVTLINKNFLIKHDHQYLIYTISLSNTSSKNIRTVIGNFSLQDFLEKEIKNVYVLIHQEVRSMSNITINLFVPYDPLLEGDERIRSKQLSDIHVVWNPEKIIYEDGKLIE